MEQNKIVTFLQTLNLDELQTVPQIVKDELKRRKQTDLEALENTIIKYYNMVNELGRKMYNISEIATIAKTTEYFVSKTLKAYKEQNESN